MCSKASPIDCAYLRAMTDLYHVTWRASGGIVLAIRALNGGTNSSVWAETRGPVRVTTTHSQDNKIY